MELLAVNSCHCIASKMRVGRCKRLHLFLTVLLVHGFIFIVLVGLYISIRANDCYSGTYVLVLKNVIKGDTEDPNRQTSLSNGSNSHESQSNTPDFQAINHCGNIFVYSAHLNDVIKPPVVRVIALGLLNSLPREVTCRYSGSDLTKGGNNSLDRNMTLETTGNVVVLPDHHDERLGAVFIHCKIPANLTHPSHVTVVKEKLNPSLSNVTILSNDAFKGRPLWKMAMCFSPLHENYNNWQQVIETFELARMLGADHAVIYVMSTGVNVSRILQLYKNIGFLEIHSWRDPPQPVHYYGQIAAINDCLLRMRYVAELVVFMDLDEMIVPRSHNTWFGILEYVRHQVGRDSSRIAAFVFRNAFFLSEPIDAKKTTKPDFQPETNLTGEQIQQARELGMETVLRQYRTVKIWKYPDRSKNIVDPLKVQCMGIHEVHTFVPGYKSAVVDTQVALLHHYRLWSMEANVRDTSALRFVPELLVRFQNKYNLTHAPVRNWKATHKCNEMEVIETATHKK